MSLEVLEIRRRFETMIGYEVECDLCKFSFVEGISPRRLVRSFRG